MWIFLSLVILADPSAARQKAEAEPAPIRLFNGMDLAGWIIENDAKAEVRDEAIVVDGMGWLRSNRTFTDFDLVVEWRAPESYLPPDRIYDSGLYIRAAAEGKPFPAPSYQVNIKKGEDGFVRGLMPHSYSHLVKPPGEWNTYRIRAEGPRITCWINGEEAWTTSEAKWLEGYIGLQAEDHPVEFRRVELIELGLPPAFPNGLEGWVATGKPGAWSVAGDTLTNAGGGGWLHTAAAHRNVILSLEFNVPKGGNSGVFLRSAPEGNPAFSGMEIQLLDNEAFKPGELKDWQLTGSLYGSYPPVPNTFTKAGEWQTIHIYCVEDQVLVWLNGTQVVDADLTRPELAERVKSGTFGLQDHDSTMQFRNVRLKVLD